ncbi:MAG: DUF2851 family protein [Bacteroidales bacterium]
MEVSSHEAIQLPGIRISQLASLLSSNDHLFARIMDESSPDRLLEIFKSRSSDYWDTSIYSE